MATTRVVAITARRRLEGPPLDWVATAATLWLMSGIFWDGWAHSYDLPDSFWTVWHAALYSGYAALAAVIWGAIAWNRPLSHSWRAAIPIGYGWGAVGAVVFGVGGLGDSIWHSLFGIEFSSNALLSPSHLMLGAGVFLMTSAPLRADWARGERSASLARRLPAVLALTAAFSILTFFNLFAGPYSDVFAAGARGSSGLLERQLLGAHLFSALVVGFLLTALRAGPLPVGAITVMLGLNAVASILMRGHAPLDTQLTFMGVAVAAGAGADALALWLRPSIERVGALRAFAFAVPAGYFAIYFAAVLLRYPVWYTPHALFGLPLLVGVTGLLLSYLVVPPRATT